MTQQEIQEDSRQYKERLNVIKAKEGGYSAYTVNMPVIVQGDSIEEVKAKAKEVAIMYLEHMLELLQEDEPFDIKEYSELDYWLNNANKPK